MRYLLVLFLVFVPFALAEEETGFENHAAQLKQIEIQKADINGVEIAYKILGSDDAPPVLMIMGLGGSHILWGDGLPFTLAEAGYRVIVFDNRDVGQSQKFTEHGDPTIWWEFIKSMIGFEVDAAYDLSHMAADGIGLLDHLGIEKAHILGASIGGMIAQVVAARYPERTNTLVSIMSSPAMFSSELPQGDQEENEFINEAAEGNVEASAQLENMGLHVDAFPRQIIAILKSGDRSEEVASISAPTLVLHGEKDRLVRPEHGARTAELIEGSTYITYPEMAHDFPAEVLPELTQDVVEHFVGAGD